MSDTPLTPPTLSYEPGNYTRRRRIRRTIAVLMLLAVVITTMITVRRYGPAVQARVRLLYRQRACMTYAAPADQVVFTNDPKLAAPLLAARFTNVNTMWWTTPDLTGRRKTAVGLFAEQWERFASTWLQAAQSGAMLFLHERVTQSGERRVVALLLFQRTYAKFEFAIESISIRPVPFWGGMPASVDGGNSASNELFRQPTENLVLYAGQPDAADESHFTIGYAVRTETGTIDGWLQDDGNVRLAVRDGPLKK